METIIIEKNKRMPGNYELVKWVLAARSKEESRYNLQTVLIGKNRIVCTDGHRLHMAKHNRTLTPGLYHVKSVSKDAIVLTADTEGSNYPNIPQILPKHPKFSVSFYHNDKQRGASYTHVVRKIPENVTLNLDYFEDTVTEGQWKVAITPDGGPVFFKNCNRSALIMPAGI